MSEGNDLTPRAGSTQDVVRRMDRMEQKHEDLAREVGVLSSTVARVEQNQTHAAELNKLRFDSLDTGIGSVKDTLDRFMGRVEGIITGEIQTAQTKTGQEMVADYVKWRKETDERLSRTSTPEWRDEVEKRLDSFDKFETQGRLLGRITVILLGGNAIAIIGVIAALLK
jgi:transcriptional regulator with XRE-family HTH domain